MRVISRKEFKKSNHSGYLETSCGKLIDEAFKSGNSYFDKVEGKWVDIPTPIFEDVDVADDARMWDMRGKEDAIVNIARDNGYRKSFKELMYELGACEEQIGKRIVYTLDVEYPESEDGYRGSRVVKKEPSFTEALMMADPEVYAKAKERAEEEYRKWEKENNVEYILID